MLEKLEEIRKIEEKAAKIIEEAKVLAEKILAEASRKSLDAKEKAEFQAEKEAKELKESLKKEAEAEAKRIKEETESEKEKIRKAVLKNQKFALDLVLERLDISR